MMTRESVLSRPQRGEWQQPQLDGPLTQRERDTFDFVRGFIESNGYAPSMREIHDSGVVSSTSVAAATLDSLEARGLLTRKFSVSRSIVLTSKGRAQE